MNIIEIKTQAEFDALKDFAEQTEIRINGNLYRIKNTPKNGLVSVYGGTIESVYGGTIQYVHGGTIQSVYGGTIEYVYGGTIQYVHGGTIEYVYGGTIQSVHGGTIEYVHGGTIEFCNTNGKILGAHQNAVIILNDCKPKFTKSVKAQIVKRKKIAVSKSDLANSFNLTVEKGAVTLYKSVRPENEKDFFSNTIEYKTGETVSCPDWNPSDKIQCGNGLHLSPTPFMALNYNKGKIKLCRVKKEDMVIFQDDLSKVRCKKVFVVGDYVPVQK